MDHSQEELLIAAIARLLEGRRHVAVGMASPIPAAASLLAKAMSGGRMRVSILGSRERQVWSDTGVELFDCAGQGRIDGFFLGGGQIDGKANINLVGVGPYPHQKVRWPGSFGSAYLYFTVPHVILFREEHSRRVLVPKVDFISAPGSSPPEIFRPGGPQALVTGRCLFGFDKAKQRFRLESLHPGHSLEEVLDNTGFEFDMAADIGETPPPDSTTLATIRAEVAPAIADAYPQFAEHVFAGAHR